jgi:hypothetical protein
MAQQKNNDMLKIQPPRIGFVEVTVGNKGMGSTLITHAMGEKVRHYLDQRGKNMLGDRKAAKEVRDPKREFLESMYYMPGSKPGGKKPKYGLVASGFKKAMVRAAKPISGIAMTDVNQTIFVHDEADGLVPITTRKAPRMREDIVQIGKGQGKTPDLRYRGEFEEWSAKLRIQFDADFFTGEEILNLLSRAGTTVGWGEMRPEKGYGHGMYQIIGTPKINEPKN